MYIFLIQFASVCYEPSFEVVAETNLVSSFKLIPKVVNDNYVVN